jgi:hypothetical protein
VQTPGTPWPSLGQMIAANKRLVVLTDDSTPHTLCDADGNPCPWYHHLWSSLAFETHFSNVGAPHLAQQVNHDFLLSARARQCWDEQGQIPNFPTVDFYEIGNVVRIANLLNFLWRPEGGPL